MANDARAETKDLGNKSTRRMEGDIIINGTSSNFKADIVNYVNNGSAFQIYGRQGEPEKSHIVSVDLPPGTPAGFYKLDGQVPIRLIYDPPRGEPFWTVTEGGVLFTFEEEEKRVHGTVQIIGKREGQELEVFVSFDIRNQ